MPKMKTVRGAAKRFKMKKNGKIKRGSAFRSHILTKKSPKRKANYKNPKTIHNANLENVKSMLCK